MIESIDSEYREIRDVFFAHLRLSLKEHERVDKASRQGQADPEFAAIFAGLAENTEEARPEEVALLIQAMVPAVVGTVKHFTARPKMESE